MTIASPQPILELTVLAEDSSRGWWTVHRILATVVAAILGATVVVTLHPTAAEALDRALVALGLDRQAREPSAGISLDEAEAVANMTVDNKAQIVAEGETAQQRNAAIPVSTASVEAAKAFVLENVGKAQMPTALKCLTQAVYYEAAFEPLVGRRAVAQVVLNRMRHPAYPKSVCGVVYQGSQRRTGCQFSFTCDGSLLRAPAAAAWREAAAVARAALSGHVESSVGTATHYHADYVLPKWAFNLAKIEQIGRHIFYRFHGGMGRASAFGGLYAGNEHVPTLNFEFLRERLAEQDQGLFQGDTVPGLTVPPHVTDRHAANDVGGRIDVTKAWRPNIPAPEMVSSRYRSIIDEASPPSNAVAMADTSTPDGAGRATVAVQP